jgi:hypothetical protein
MRTSVLFALAVVLSACEYRADLLPTPASAASRRPTSRVGEPEAKTHQTRIGIRYFFKEAVPKGWTIVREPGRFAEPTVTTLCMVRNEANGSRVLFLLKSYVEPSADPKAYQEAILANPDAWIAATPPSFSSDAPLGDDKGSGYVAVGSFEGQQSRWLIAAGRWRTSDQDAMAKDMQAMVIGLAATSTTTDVADADRRLCGDYY